MHWGPGESISKNKIRRTSWRLLRFEIIQRYKILQIMLDFSHEMKSTFGENMIR